MTCGIYIVTTINGDRYIGASTDLERRKEEHRYRFRGGVFGVLEECPKEELTATEWFWVAALEPELNKDWPYIDKEGNRKWISLARLQGHRQRIEKIQAEAAERNRQREERRQQRLANDPRYRRKYELNQAMHARLRAERAKRQQAS